MDRVRSLGPAPLRDVRPVLLSAALLLTATASAAQDAGEASKLSVPRGDHREYFGSAISLDRSAGPGELRVLIGAPTRSGSGEAGSAHLFRLRDGEWVHEKEFRGVEESAPLASPHVRRALKLSFGVFRVERWALEQEWMGTSDDYQFGDSVSIDGDHAIVGVPYYGPDRGGAAHVYRRDKGKWAEALEIVASDPGPRDFLGQAVSMGGGYAAAGAPNEDCNDTCYGAVYLRKLPAEMTAR